jgi:hypothetical protein
MANSSDKRDGSGSSEWEEDRSETSKTKDHSGRSTETRAHDEDDGKDKEKNFHVSRKTLTIGDVCVGVVLICVFLYWLHARNFESTNDAYTTTHVHEISARVAGTVETVNVDDNQLVKAGHPLVVLVPITGLAVATLAARDAGSGSASCFGVAILSTLITRREQFHDLRVGELVTVYSPAT